MDLQKSCVRLLQKKNYYSFSASETHLNLYFKKMLFIIYA